MKSTETEPRKTRSKLQIILMTELEARCKKNPQYSLRAFARSLTLNPAMLSMVLSGQRNFSPATAKRVAKELGLDPHKSAEFLRGTNLSKTHYTQKGQYSEISMDKFSAISGWHHFGILSLIETVDFKPSMTWIASRLGIRAVEAAAAVNRLERLGLLDTTRLPWRQVGGPIMIENEVSTAATRQFQFDVLDKAQKSLDAHPPGVRDISSVTLAIDPKDMPLAIEEIRKFKIYLMELLEKRKAPKEVYHLAVQLYPITRTT